MGESCEHVFVNIISQHTRLIDSAGIQIHADCSAPELFFFFFFFVEQSRDTSLKDSISLQKKMRALPKAQALYHQRVNNEEQRTSWSIGASPKCMLTGRETCYTLQHTHTCWSRATVYITLTHKQRHRHICIHCLILTESELNLEVCSLCL